MKVAVVKVVFLVVEAMVEVGWFLIMKVYHIGGGRGGAGGRSMNARIAGN